LIFETHAHYDHRQYDPDRDALISALPSRGVGAVLNVGSSMESSRASVALAERYAIVSASVGVHPHDAKTLTDEFLRELHKISQHPKVVAFGEIGLDFNRNFSPPDVQRFWFKRQLELAGELGLPLIIHSRDADDEVYDILAAHPRSSGVIHAFPGDVTLAQKYIALGFMLGIGGVLTYDKTGRLKSVVQAVPLDKILPHRGKRNESSHLKYIAAAIAEIKTVSLETVAALTFENARALYARPASL
jgi:TatD DNase family protein